MGYEYGILTEPSSYSSARTSLEIGWSFSVGSESISISGLRVKLPSAQNVVGKLWDMTSKTMIASCSITASNVCEWNEALFESPVVLSPGCSYAITCNTAYWYYGFASSFSFHPKINYISSAYTPSFGQYPSSADAGRVYTVIDLIIVGASASYKPTGNATFSISIPEIENVSESAISWESDEPDGTAVDISCSLDGVNYQNCTNGGLIPCISAGESLIDKTLYLKVILSTDDPSTTPSVSNISMTIGYDSNADKIVLHFPSGCSNSIQRAKGEVKISYNGGTLAGEGGIVLPFEETFIPYGLEAKDNPNDMEHIDLSVQASGVLKKIIFNDTQDQEHLCASLEISAALINIADL